MKIDQKLTPQEEKAFNPPVTKGLALDYFYIFNNAPLNFAYGDGYGNGVEKGTYTEEEARNKVLQENLWLDAYNQYVVGELYFPFLYLDVQVLQSPLQTYYYDGLLNKPMRDKKETKYLTLEEVYADFKKKLETFGEDFYKKSRSGAPGFEFRILLGAPDRTCRIMNAMPVGNQVIFEAVEDWTENGVVKQTAYSTCVVYGKDGLVLQDRSYMDMKNWPGHCADWFDQCGYPKRDPKLGQQKGYAEDVYAYSKTFIEVNDMTPEEKRNKEIADGAWIASYDSLDTGIYHPVRYRMQLPMQKISYNLDYWKKIEKEVKEKTPSRKITQLMSYAKGNQVSIECLMSWTDEDGVYREIPYITWLLFDKDGKIIRERRYFDVEYWPSNEVFKNI